MQAGRLEQVDPPDAIYRNSATPFVAEFLGVTNLLSGTIVRREAGRAIVRVGATEFVVDEASAGRSSIPGAPSRAAAADAGAGESAILFCVRPEALRVVARGEAIPEGWADVEARIARLEFLGALIRVETQLADGTVLRVALLDQPLATLAVEQPLRLAYDPRRVTCFASR